ncbi:MAG: glycosyltransferase, partial [Deltaproteobacteria bacterium]
MSISIIIPTLNEEGCLKKTLKSIGRGTEIIVVDGGSSDSTREIANDFTEKVILSERGRGAQMDRGAREASALGGGDILLLLHADTILPEDWRGCIENALKDDRVIAGGFSLKIDSKGFSFRLIEAVANIRAKYLGLIYGDQAI